MFEELLVKNEIKDNLWYAIKNNQIIDWDQYGHDLEKRLKDIKDVR